MQRTKGTLTVPTSCMLGYRGASILSRISRLKWRTSNRVGGLRHHSLLRPSQAFYSMNAVAERSSSSICFFPPPYCRRPWRIRSMEVTKNKTKKHKMPHEGGESLVLNIRSQQKKNTTSRPKLSIGHCFELCTFRDSPLRTSRLSPFLMLDDAGSTATNDPPRRTTAAWKEHAVLVEVS